MRQERFRLRNVPFTVRSHSMCCTYAKSMGGIGILEPSTIRVRLMVTSRHCRRAT